MTTILTPSPPAPHRAPPLGALHGTRGWELPLRLAWRDIRGHRTRSILAMVMIGTPVLLASGLMTALSRQEGLADSSGVNGLFYAVSVSYDSVVGSTAIALVVIELTLLAGPALAVGVRQQRLTLAQLAATGADARALRRVVIAQGLLLGVVAALAGAGLGVVAGLGFTLGPPDRWADAYAWGPLDVPWLWVGFAMALGIVAAVLAAYAPAITAARNTVISARGLARGETRYPWGRALVGAVIFVGAASVLFVETSGGSTDSGLAALCVLSLTVGMLLVIPLIVALLLPAGRVLPPVWRLATRDSARAANRSIAAIAAVTAATGGLVASGTFLASYDQIAQARYVPPVPLGSAVALVPDAAALDRISTAIASAVPGAATEAVRGPAPGYYRIRQNLCANTCSENVRLIEPVVTPGPVMAGFDNPELDAFVADGGIVIWGPQLGPPWLGGSGTLIADVDSNTDPSAARRSTPVDVLAVPGEHYAGGGAVMSQETADRLHGSVVTRISVGSGELTDADLDRLERAVSNAGGYAELGRGWTSGTSSVALAITIAALLAVVGGTLTATALTLTDARRERAILAAVGARPLTSRLTAAATAIVIAAVGAVTGTVLGLVIGVLASRVLSWQLVQPVPGAGLTYQLMSPTVVPWPTIALVVVVLPLALGLVVALVARGPSPLEGARSGGSARQAVR